MKKWIALLLAAVMCLPLVACGGGETPDVSDNGDQQGDNTDQKRVAEFTEILCGKWVARDEDWELTFREDGTFFWHSDTFESEYPWSFFDYLDTPEEYQLPTQHALDFSDAYGLFLGNDDGRGGQILVGYRDDGSLEMYYFGKFWDKTE